ncbi:MAG: hypothetical protein AUK63_2478 [bacterium P3]|nr:MAG: hypothetical protein AUK63_2478 [bacterium P3]KWW27560.1 MAG: hypothetical protein F083_2980 [bacterium F083]
MKNKILTLFLTATLAAAALLLACGKEKEQAAECTFCHVENPLTDLEWLKEIVEEINSIPLVPRSIYTCIYLSGTEGFIISECDNCPDAGEWLYDCSGNRLCLIGGLDGERGTAYDIDWDTKETIYRNY